MNKRRITALFAACALLCGCGNGQTAETTTAAVTAVRTEADTTISAASPEDATAAPAQTLSLREQAEKMTAGMTLEQKIAQMITISLRRWSDTPDDPDSFVNVTELNDKQRELLKSCDFGGIVLFDPNCTDTEQTARLTAAIQDAARESEQGIPMLISADQEGGSIVRLGKGTTTCGNMALGAAGDEQSAFDNAAILGSELAAVGINTDYAPDCDVNDNPSNPVINVRSFSSVPELVAKLSRAFIQGLESEGVISTAKHYPGHGDTSTDSHTGLPMIDKSYDELKQTELVPFAAVADEADMIMTAHIQFPQIETETYTSVESGEEISLPATLSKKMIKDILRGDMGYDGVVTTDDMLMDAIDTNFDVTDAAVLAINADVDILLEPINIMCENDIKAQTEYIGKLVAAVNDGRIAESEIDDSVIRIITLKLEKGIIGAEPVDADAAAKTAKTIVGSKEHHDKELEVALRAVTLVKNDDGTIPLKLGENEKVAYFYPYAGEENTMTFALDRLKADGIVPDSVTAKCHSFTEKSASDDYAGIANDVAGYEELIKGCKAVIIATETYRRENMDRTDEKRAWQAVFSDEMTALAHRNGIKVVHLSMQMPYDAVRYSAADAVLCAYCANDMPAVPTEYNGETTTYGVNYPAALITVFGGSAPTGKLPVDLPGYTEGVGYTDEIVYPVGHGLTY
ncbi:MAG: beta-hexosaminidase [Ruminiclostridium sp.]|nr:beta-hexosaminidase [Ruminiclostridium sp.]